MRRQAEKQRFNQLVGALGASASRQEASGGPTIMAAPSTVFPGPLPSTPVPKATVVSPPTLSKDATLQAFKEWRQQWEDNVVMMDLHKQP